MDLGILEISTVILLYLLRFRFDDETARDEIKLTAWLTFLLYRASLGRIPSRIIITFSTFSYWICVATLAAGSVCIYFTLSTKPSWRDAKGSAPKIVNDEISIGKPLLLPSRTSHVRLFPKKHSFSYSYLLVGIPVGWRGSAGSLVSVDTDSIECNSIGRKKAWFSVDGAEYLHRGYDDRGLLGKLDAYLKTENEKLKDYPFVYLVTAPCFLGYSFNPVSFWYLYGEDHNLKAMILEVNNTFDERRIYLLRAAQQKISSCAEGDLASQLGYVASEQSNGTLSGRGDLTGKKTAKFTDSWAKDFHVSPFNSRKGAYSLTADDPITHGRLNNTITLSSSKGHPKLVAKIFSVDDPADPSKMGTMASWRFIASWCWVGFATFPRIVREAAKLFFRRNLHVWYRPEVLRQSIGRKETAEEKVIGSCFRLFLKATVEQSSMQVPVNYTAAMASSSETFHPLHLDELPQADEQDSPTAGIDFKVTTPLFYRQLVRYSHISELISDSLLTLPTKSQTFYVSDPQALVKLFDLQQRSSRLKSPPRLRSRLDYLRWHFLNWLRSFSSEARARVQSHAGRTLMIQDIRPRCFSMLDGFALQSHDADMANKYRKTVVKLLMSDKVAFGEPLVLDVLDWIVRVGLCYLVMRSLAAVLSHDAGARSETHGDGLRMILVQFKTMLVCSTTHIWWAIKELP